MQLIKITCTRCHAKNRVVIRDPQSGICRCGKCKNELFEASFIEGYIYILSNDLMPGLLKIGCTARDVESRVSELSRATGVPAPFKIEGYFVSVKVNDDEAAVHNELREYRSTSNREFFRCSVDVALRCVSKIVGSSQVTTLSQLFTPASKSDDEWFKDIIDSIYVFTANHHDARLRNIRRSPNVTVEHCWLRFFELRCARRLVFSSETARGQIKAAGHRLREWHDLRPAYEREMIDWLRRQTF